MTKATKINRAQPVLNHIGQTFSNFIANRNGNIGTMFALTILPLIIAVGAAVDYSQLVSDVNYAQDRADAVVLNAAIEYYQDFSGTAVSTDEDFASNFRLGSSNAEVERDVDTAVSIVDGNMRTLKTTISGTTQHAFVGIVGKPKTNWTVTSYSTVSIPQVEIILVIDVSNSMQGERLTQLKLAMDKFIDDIAPYRRGDSHIAISILPFAEYVNFGTESKTWLTPSLSPQDSTTFNGCFISSADERPGTMLNAVFGARNNGRPFCPESESEAVLFSTNAEALKTQISGLTLGWGTQTERAMIWAERMLDNAWRNSSSLFSAETPVQVSNDTQKVVILLTDGQVAITDPDEDGVARPTEEVVAGFPLALELFNTQCQSFDKFQNLSLFTVAYTVRDATFEAAMRDCVKGDGAYFDAELDELDSAFTSIADSLSPIRITR